MGLVIWGSTAMILITGLLIGLWITEDEDLAVTTTVFSVILVFALGLTCILHGADYDCVKYEDDNKSPAQHIEEKIEATAEKQTSGELDGNIWLCPYCGAMLVYDRATVGSDVDIESGTTWKYFHCENCEATFKMQFSYADISVCKVVEIQGK